MGKTYDLLVRARGETADAQRAMKQLQTQVRKTGDRMASAGKMMTVGLTLPIIGAGAKMVMLASDAEETASKLRVTFGGATAGVVAQLDKFSKATGASRYELREQAATIGALLKPMKLGGKATAAMSVEVAKLATDLGSFNNVPVGEALASLKSGLTGETEPLKKFGILMNEAAVEAEGLRLGLVKATQNTDDIKSAQIKAQVALENYNEAVKEHGKDSLEAKAKLDSYHKAQRKIAEETKGSIPKMTEQQKVQARYSLILKQSTDAQGDATRTSNSFANQVKRLKSSLRDLGTDMGKTLLPHVQKLVEWLQRGAARFEGLSDRGKRVALIIAAITAVMGPVLVVLGTLVTACAALTLPILGAVAAGVAFWGALVVLYKHSSRFRSIVASLSKVVMRHKILLLGLLGPGALLIGVLVRLYQKNQMFRTIVNAVAGAVRAYIRVVVTAISTLVSFASTVGAAIARSRTFHAVVTVVRAAVSLVASATRVWAGTVSSVGGALLTVILRLGSPLQKPLGWVRKNAGAAFDAMRSALSTIDAIVGSIVSGLASLISKLDSAISKVGSLRDKAGGAIGKLPGLARGGTVTRSGRVMVGEQGPEILNLPRGASVVPLSKSRMLSGGGGGNTYNIYPQSEDVESIARRVAFLISSGAVQVRAGMA